MDDRGGRIPVVSLTRPGNPLRKFAGLALVCWSGRDSQKGEHTDEVLREYGYDDQAISAFRARKIV
jgi:crotonobetainyl-CoA:carnitine CoA-transferase CaiB-like acyl-CoA transferase